MLYNSFGSIFFFLAITYKRKKIFKVLYLDPKGFYWLGIYTMNRNFISVTDIVIFFL